MRNKYAKVLQRFNYNPMCQCKRRITNEIFDSLFVTQTTQQECSRSKEQCKKLHKDNVEYIERKYQRKKLKHISVRDIPGDVRSSRDVCDIFTQQRNKNLVLYNHTILTTYDVFGQEYLFVLVVHQLMVQKENESVN